jgi:PAS domain-containing protein
VVSLVSPPHSFQVAPDPFASQRPPVMPVMTELDVRDAAARSARHETKAQAETRAYVFAGAHFLRILRAAGISISDIETAPSIIYALDPDLRIIFCNRAWDNFARENGGRGISRVSVLGTQWLNVIPEPLRKFYADGAAEAQHTGKPWEHDFECSSPEVHRRFHMRVLPLPEGHFLIENSTRVETPHPQNLDQDDPNFTHVDPYGIVTMCSHCRRVRRADASQRRIWDWVPFFVRKAPARVSHGLCPTCCAYFYGAEGEGATHKAPAEKANT